MKRSWFSEDQIIATLREAEAGATAEDVCRRHGVSEQSLWRGRATHPQRVVIANLR